MTEKQYESGNIFGKRLIFAELLKDRLIFFYRLILPSLSNNWMLVLLQKIYGQVSDI